MFVMKSAVVLLVKTIFITIKNTSRTFERIMKVHARRKLNNITNTNI